MFQSTWRKSSPASYLRKSANSTDAPRRVERRSPRVAPGKARRARIRSRSSFLRNEGSRNFDLGEAMVRSTSSNASGEIGHGLNHVVQERIGRKIGRASCRERA